MKSLTYLSVCRPRVCLAQEARNVKDIADSIEEERAKVVAKTPVTEAVSGARSCLVPCVGVYTCMSRSCVHV